jgi:two-component system chemotaxis response regulator CheY
MRVLIAEDSGVMRTIIARALANACDSKPVVAEDGAAAWQCFQAEKFDLVIVDWHMPRINGIDLVKLIRRKCSEVPVLMVSVVDTRSDIIKALEAGVTDYLCKPFDRDELESKLHKHAQQQSCF